MCYIGLKPVFGPKVLWAGALSYDLVILTVKWLYLTFLLFFLPQWSSVTSLEWTAQERGCSLWPMKPTWMKNWLLRDPSCRSKPLGVSFWRFSLFWNKIKPPSEWERGNENEIMLCEIDQSMWVFSPVTQWRLFLTAQVRFFSLFPVSFLFRIWPKESQIQQSESGKTAVKKPLSDFLFLWIWLLTWNQLVFIFCH